MGESEATTEESEATTEEVLLAAAAEVSTPSSKRRLRIFRETLTPLLAEVTESASYTRLLVNIIFQTLPLYDDPASRKAVDNMVIWGLSKSTFMNSFAATLVQYMERVTLVQSSIENNLKVTRPLACFKLLRWSMYLLEWTQFATLPQSGFSTMAKAQAVLSQVLMDGSFRQRKTCKRLFIRLFSQSVEIYKMYIEAVKDSRISAMDAPAFINLILDFLIRSSSLLSEYKPVFLDLYVKTILSSKVCPSKAACEAFKPLLLAIGNEEFENTVCPSSIKMLRRNPEIVLQPIGLLLMTVPLDLSQYSKQFMQDVLRQARHSDEERRIDALKIVGTLSEKCSHEDTLPSMFHAIKASLDGSEEKLSLTCEKVGMLNALEHLSRLSPEQTNRLAPSVSRLAPSVSGFLIWCYKCEALEEVKLAALSALGSWASVSPEAVQPDVVSFITAGLKEKDTLRKGHLKLIRVICKKNHSLNKVTSLLDHLIQLSKTGFTKATQRLDGIYALYAISRLAAIDDKSDSLIVKQKLWALIAQSEPSVIPVQLLSNLTDEDCLTCVDLLQSLLVDHFKRVKEYFSIQSVLEVLIYLLCHPSWAVRKIAYDVTDKVLSSSGALAEDLLFLFTNCLSLVGERMSILKQSRKDSSTDSRRRSIPYTDVLVNCFFLIAPYVVDHSRRSYSRLMLSSHHSCISTSGSPAGVWKRLQRRLKHKKICLTDLICASTSDICKELLSQNGLFSSNKEEHRASLCSLSSLMTISPNDTFTEFEKHFTELHCALHDGFSKNDIKIFFTPEGQLFDKTIYVGEAKTMLLKEEASVRDKVGQVLKNLALMLVALCELATADPIFIQGRLFDLVTYIEPLLSWPIVSDAAFCAMVRLIRCADAPLRNWATDIAAATRVMSVKDFDMVLYLEPVEKDQNSTIDFEPTLFERIVARLTAACNCKERPFPADSFTYIFPIIERILLSSGKTCLHDNVLQILSKHLDPILPSLRPRMLSVLYHVLSTIPAYHPSVEPMLNELCQHLQCNDLAQALVGVYAKEVCIRRACLTAIKCAPIQSVQHDLEVSTSLWIAIHDSDKEVAKVAEELWVRFRFVVGTDYSGIYTALFHKNDNIRAAAAFSLTAALKQNPGKIQDTLSTLISLYIDPGAESGNRNLLGGDGISLALESVADVLCSNDLPILMEFFISHALADPNLDVRSRMINAGILLIEKHGQETSARLFPIFKRYLNKRESDDIVRNGVVQFTDTLAKFLPKGNSEVWSVVEKLVTVPASDTDQNPKDRIMDLHVAYEDLLVNIKSAASEMFDVVYFEGELRIGLKSTYFVSLGPKALEIYHLLFNKLEYHHAHNECLSRFSAKDVRYVPSLKCLVFSENVHVCHFSRELFRHNIKDAGNVLAYFRYSPIKVAAGKSDIFELDRTKSVLPPYLATLVNKTADMASPIDGLREKWRLVYKFDLAGKGSSGRIGFLNAVDLHHDYLTKRQREYFESVVGVVINNWKTEAENVPSIKAVIDYAFRDRDTDKWTTVDYDGTSLMSLWTCGRNKVNHADKNKMSEKEAEAIFSSKFHVELSRIIQLLLVHYKEPTPPEGKEGNRFTVLQIVKME